MVILKKIIHFLQSNQIEWIHFYLEKIEIVFQVEVSEQQADSGTWLRSDLPATINIFRIIPWVFRTANRPGGFI
jgi:hypothetical protein